MENHKLIDSTIRDDVSKGYATPLPVGMEKLLPSSMVVPVGIVEQHNINKDGSITFKNRLTHDQTYIHLKDSKS
jgi:hypothetical protein